MLVGPSSEGEEDDATSARGGVSTKEEEGEGVEVGRVGAGEEGIHVYVEEGLGPVLMQRKGKRGSREVSMNATRP